MLIIGRLYGQIVKLRVPPSDTETDIEILVVGERRGGIRLGFTAPRSVLIDRPEWQPTEGTECNQ